MVDNVDQLPSVKVIHAQSSITPAVFLKVDMGARRAGVPLQTAACTNLITSLLSLESAGQANLLGLYAHAGQSYYGSSRITAMSYLRQELQSLIITSQEVHNLVPSKHLILTVGATPTTTSIRNLLLEYDANTAEGQAIAALRATIATIREENCEIEVHAGVYPMLDLQQLATNALPTEGPDTMLSWDDMALTILAEVASVYPGRGANSSTEALVGSGTLALGREPCKAYPGWGIVTPWNRDGVSMPSGEIGKHVGWQVGRISQEHGILTWSGEGKKVDGLKVGQKVRIWPNHACVAGAGFGWYLVVDGSVKGREDEIVDVWPRWRGW